MVDRYNHNVHNQLRKAYSRHVAGSIRKALRSEQESQKLSASSVVAWFVNLVEMLAILAGTIDHTYLLPDQSMYMHHPYPVLHVF